MPTEVAESRRLQIVTPRVARSQFCRDVTLGLQQTQKFLLPKYFYDEQGSRLFEAICAQPEYYLTRTEALILKNHAADIVGQTAGTTLVELGSGSSAKTRLLFDEYRRQEQSLHYVPIDISPTMLEETVKGLMKDYPLMSVDPLATDYLNGLSQLPNARRRLVLFLGSNLGNFDIEQQRELFKTLADALHQGDQFLLGVDLRKPVSILEAAYNDVAGVTAEFNLNILRHINREMNADFNLEEFSHFAFYNAAYHQIEMHLRSRREQKVWISDLDLTVPFAEGETIHTEISRKFDAGEIEEQLQQYGFVIQAEWTDPDSLFLLTLFRYGG